MSGKVFVSCGQRGLERDIALAVSNLLPGTAVSDYVNQQGYKNIGAWVDQAAQQVVSNPSVRKLAAYQRGPTPLGKPLAIRLRKTIHICLFISICTTRAGHCAPNYLDDFPQLIVALGLPEKLPSLQFGMSE
jgi:hypothetical protein